MDKVRTAFIGVGYRGKQLFRLLQNIPFFQVQAVADPGVKSSEISGAITKGRMPALIC